jgi:hypothetical protein
MKRVLIGMACALFAGSVAQATAGGQGTKSVQGTISALTTSSITVKVKDQEMTFVIDPKTDVIAKGGATQTRAAQAAGKQGAVITDILKIGQGVEVKYKTDGMLASSIRGLSGTPSGSMSTDNPTLRANGVVTAVAGTSLTVKGTGGEWTFVIDEKTRVTGTGASTKSREKKAAGEKTTIMDFVAMGDTVAVTYHDMSGTKHASAVRVTKKGSTN